MGSYRTEWAATGQSGQLQDIVTATGQSDSYRTERTARGQMGSYRTEWAATGQSGQLQDRVGCYRTEWTPQTSKLPAKPESDSFASTVTFQRQLCKLSHSKDMYWYFTVQ